MSIFFHEPPEPGRPGTDYLWLALTSLGGIGLAVLFAPYNVLLGITAGAIAAIAIWTIPGLLLRGQVLDILREVSAAHAHDKFLRLALQVTSSQRQARRHWHVLTLIAQRRKHPNASTLRALNEAIAAGLTEETVAQAHRVAKRIIEAKARIRQNTTSTLQAYLRTKITDKTVVVLYGFSTVVCDAFAPLDTNNSGVLIIADQQYGGASQREHDLVQRRLQTKARAPRIIPFAEAKQLLTGKQTVTDLDGSVINLGNKPTLLLLGCEAYATDGSVLVPAQTDDDVADTSALLQLLKEAPTPRRKRLQLVVAAETYKLHAELKDLDRVVTPPMTFSPATLPRRIAYRITGRADFLGENTVRLVRIDLRDIHAIIDDAGVHHAGDLSALKDAMHAWSRMLRTARGPEDLGFTVTCEAYILDMNGVLSNDEHLHHAAFVELVAEHHGTLTPAEYNETCVGSTDREGIERLIERGRLAGDPTALIAQKREKYRRFAAGGAKPYRHAHALVQRLVDLGKRVYLVTSATEEEAHRFVSQAGLAFAFARHNIYTDVTSVTRASVYRKIVTETRLDPSGIVVVDDTPANLVLAQSLRLRTIGVQTTHPHEVRADQLVRDADDLYTLIKGSPTY